MILRILDSKFAFTFNLYRYILDHGLYTELEEEERRRMCRLWYAVALRNPARVSAVSEEMGVPKSLRWVLPQLMARQTSNVSPEVGGANGVAGGRVGASLTTFLCSFKTHSIDDSQYGPCKQSDTRECQP